MTPYLTVAMPAYNEADNLARNLPRLTATLSTLVPSFEIIIVDDGSHDATREVALRVAANDPRIRVICHAVNSGIGAGFMTALHVARGERFILIPADLALDLADLYKYFEAAECADIVVGLRSDRRDYSAFRKLVSWANIWLIRTLFGTRLHQFNYISLYPTRCLQQMEIRYTGSAFFFAEILIRAQDLGFRLREVTIRYEPRASGRQTGANLPLILRTVRDLVHFRLTRSLGRARRRSAQP